MGLEDVVVWWFGGHSGLRSVSDVGTNGHWSDPQPAGVGGGQGLVSTDFIQGELESWNHGVVGSLNHRIPELEVTHKDHGGNS